MRYDVFSPGLEYYEDLPACVSFNITIPLCLFVCFWMVTVGFEWVHGQ